MPELERVEVMDSDGVLESRLTPASEVLYANYLTEVGRHKRETAAHMASLALEQVNEYDMASAAD